MNCLFKQLAPHRGVALVAHWARKAFWPYAFTERPPLNVSLTIGSHCIHTAGVNITCEWIFWVPHRVNNRYAAIRELWPARTSFYGFWVLFRSYRKKTKLFFYTLCCWNTPENVSVLAKNIKVNRFSQKQYLLTVIISLCVHLK